jgi:CelD/BcsL family acetyltransferase involved in cellulose biosynthesis
VNPPGALQWTIGNWEAKWRGDSASPRADLGDRLAADEFLQERGQHVTFALLDGEQLIAGDACVVDNGDLVSLVTYRRPEYQSYYLGHALTDRMVAWAKRSGFQRLDLGGGFDYKIQLAPIGGQKVELLICPELQYRFCQLMGHGRTLLKALSVDGVAQRGFQRLHRGIRNRWLARVES